MRLAVPMLVVGDDLLRAGADDLDAGVPIGAVGGDAQLQERVALTRVQPVLHHEHAGAALGHGLVEEAGAAAEIVHHRVQAADHCVFGGHAFPRGCCVFVRGVSLKRASATRVAVPHGKFKFFVAYTWSVTNFTRI